MDMGTSCVTKKYPEAFLKAVDIMFLQQKEKQAIDYLTTHRNKNIITTLSGKDSLVALHLAFRSFGKINVYINRYVGQRRLPDAVVKELMDIGYLFANEVIIGNRQWGPHGNLFSIIARELEDIEIIVTGLRRQEDGDGAIGRYVIGGRSVDVVSPIYRWKLSDVWAYVYKYGLPLPSPYCFDAPPWASLQSLIQ